MKYQVCFHAKKKKKMLSLHLLRQKFFYSEMVWYFSEVYSVYNKENIT